MNVTIEVQNRSGLTEKEASGLLSVFEEELGLHGVKISSQPVASRILLIFSDTPAGYLVVAQLKCGEASDSWIEALDRPLGAHILPVNSGLSLQRELVFASEEPILDLVFSEQDSKSVQVLNPLQITWYRREGDHWKQDTAIKLPRKTPPGRDLRGQLSFGIDDMSAVFPTETCNLSIHDGDRCHQSAARVDLSDVPSTLEDDVEEKESSSWLSATRLQSEGKRLLLITAKDGRMRMYGDDSEPLATFSSFGDQVAAIKSDCGSSWQALVSLRDDDSKPDSVQGFEIQDQKLIAVTQPLQFAGPVRALRGRNRSMGSQSSDAIAIILSLQTGLYEVYRLSITCSN